MSQAKKPRKSYLNTVEEAFIDYDGKWKIIIERLFEQFILFFLPKLYPLIDFTFDAKFLKQDIEKIVSTNSKKDDQIYDNLAEVRLKTGDKGGLLVHIEVQSYEAIDLSQRMLQYCYRGLDKFNLEKHFTALAILVADKLPKNYKGYHYQFGDTSLDYTFPVYIIKNQQESELLKSDNPFALAVLTCLKLLKIRARNKRNRKGEYLDRFIVKKELMTLLEERFQNANYTEKEIVAILEFVINIIALPERLEEKFKEEFYEPYINQQQNMELSPKGKIYANMVTKAYFGSTYDEIVLQIQQIKEKWQEDRKEKEEAIRKAEEDRKQKEEAIRKAEEDRKQKEEAIRKAEEDRKQKEEVLQKQEKQILNFYFNIKLSKEQIAQAMELELDFIKNIIAKKEAE